MYKQQIFVLDVIRVRADFTTLKGISIQDKQRHNPHKILIKKPIPVLDSSRSSKPPGSTMLKASARTRTNSRACSASRRCWNPGGKLPDAANWLTEFLRELLSFPSAKHDDQFDDLPQGLIYMRERLEEPGIIGFYRMEVGG